MKSDIQAAEWVWDPLLRVFKWSFTLMFLLAYLTEGEQEIFHYFAGFMLLGLIVFRVVWGVIGTQNSLWASFMSSWQGVKQHFFQLVRLQKHTYEGHDPIGGWMIVLMLLTIGLTALTGMALLAEDNLGPFANSAIANLPHDPLEEVHEFLANLSLLWVVIHIVGVIGVSVLNKTNLVRPMITGKASSNSVIVIPKEQVVGQRSFNLARYLVGIVLLALALLMGLYGASLA